jgi:hypothetical protein
MSSLTIITRSFIEVEFLFTSSIFVFIVSFTFILS